MASSVNDMYPKPSSLKDGFPQPIRYEDVSAWQDPHYMDQERMGCCVPSDHPNAPYWTPTPPYGTCGNLYTTYSQCCGLSGRRCLNRDSPSGYDKFWGRNFFYADPNS